MNRSPRVTVLMTVYNAGRFLEPAIASIAGQTFRDWEFLIVDDASTDGSAEIAASWARRDGRIRVIRNAQNKGQTPCLNQGLRAARGAWVARQDADDLSHPLRLTRQFEQVTIHPEIVLLGTAGRMIDANDRLCGLLDVPATRATIRAAAAFLNPFLHTSVFFRREVILDALGGYDPAFRIAQDYDLWERVIAKYPAANLPARLVCYRHLEASLSKAGSGEAFREAARVAARGRIADPAFAAALAALREGRPVNAEALFQALHFLGRDMTGRDRRAWRRYSAALFLRAAGGRKTPSALLRAFALDPAFAISWSIDRMLG